MTLHELEAGGMERLCGTPCSGGTNSNQVSVNDVEWIRSLWVGQEKLMETIIRPSIKGRIRKTKVTFYI